MHVLEVFLGFPAISIVSMGPSIFELDNERTHPKRAAPLFVPIIKIINRFEIIKSNNNLNYLK